jgi:uncharacterized protein
MILLLSGLGLVFVVEGLVLALAPLRIEAVMQFLMTLSKDQRRTLGLAAVALGTGLVLLAHRFGA